MLQLTIDVGTTQIKCNLFEETVMIKEEKINVMTYYEPGGRVYQKPVEIIESIKQGIQLFLSEGYQFDQLLFSTAMHSIMPVFHEKEYGDLLIWLDQRPSKWIKKFKEDKELAASFYQSTGTPIHEMSPFAKIGYFKKETWFDSVEMWQDIKTCLMEQFVGKTVLDYSVASATGLFNSLDNKWDKDILEYLGISTKQLPQLVDTDWSEEMAEEMKSALGITWPVKVFVGGSDGCLVSLGSYLAHGTSSTVTLGTSGAVRKITKERQLDPEGKTFCYYITKEYWVIGGATNNGGKVLEWAGEMFYENTSIYSKLAHILETSPIGSRGITFLPYISGERAPLWSSEVSGELIGLKLGHQKEDMLRSVIEGILLNTKWLVDIIDLDYRLIALSGGFFKEDFMVELTADVLGRNCLRSDYSEPSYGLIGLASPNKLRRVTNGQSVFVNKNNQNEYEKVYKLFLEQVNTNHNK